MKPEAPRPEDLTPLFIPLKTEFYCAFENGTKLEEFRPFGPRWNDKTAPVARRVVLAHGYGREQMTGVITATRLIHDVASIPGWKECYGDRPGPCIAIKIAITSLP